MKQAHPLVAPSRRESAGGKLEEDESWRDSGSIFSPVFQPVLKLVGLDDDGAGGAASPSNTGTPRSSLSRSDGTGSSGSGSSAASVPTCSLASPALYASGAHTPTPPRRQPSPITTPKQSIAVPNEEPSPAIRYTHTHTSAVVVAQAGDTSVALAAANDSWESELTADDGGDMAGDDMDDVEYDEDDFNPYLFIKLLPRYEDVAPRRRRVVLPRKARGAPKISLVLDLDETLVHCSIEPIPDADLTFSVAFNGQDYQVYVRKRPYLAHFLEEVSKLFEVTVFTASQSVYAETLLDLIDPKRRLVKYRLFREACLNVDGNYLKDLTVLGRDLKQTVLVDNSPHAFGYQVDNGIPIESWFDDPHDTELLKLLQFLKTLPGCKDVRPPVRRKFRVWDLINAA